MNPREFHDRIMAGDASGVQALTAQAIDADIAPIVIINEYLVPVMAEVGRLFEEGEIFIPEMLLAAQAMQSGMTLVKPLLVGDEAKTAGMVVLGTVEGDLHDIGKTLVGTLLGAAGFEVHDLGTDVSPQRFVEEARRLSPAILGMSAMLTTTMPAMKRTIEALTEAGLRERLTVLVGGAPLTPEYARSIGADGYAEDAAEAAQMARSMLGA